VRSSRSNRSQQTGKRSSARGPIQKRQALLEQLENRHLMAGDSGNYPDWVNAPLVEATGMFANASTFNAFRDAYSTQLGNGGGGTGGGLAGEGGSFNGGDGDSSVLPELEPNNLVRDATKLPLGFGNGQLDAIDVQGSLPAGDTDFFLVNLRRGDILNVQVNGSAGDISVGPLNSSGLGYTEWIGNDQPSGGVYAADSPLLGEGNASLAITLEADGIYVVRVGAGFFSIPGGSYVANFRVFRPAAEQTPVGTVQTVFLDFDGEILDLGDTPFGGSGTVRLPPVTTAFASLGLLPSDLNRFIDLVVAGVKEDFGDVASIGTNGDYEATGIAGQYGLQILNSRDHADPWGLPNVSRVIIAGTNPFGIPGLGGIAQSVDVGNFGLEETALVFADVLQFFTGVPVSGGTSRLDFYASVTDDIVSHEMGHYYGNWHTDPFNLVSNMQDNFITTNEGPDGVWGTPDDNDLDFGEDEYAPIGSRIRFGINDTLNNIANNLPTGLIGGTIKGLVWQDANQNRKRESGEKGLAGVTVYVDLNGNRIRDSLEPAAITDAAGKYVLRAPRGESVIRVVEPDSSAQTQPTKDDGYRVNLSVDQTISDRDFGIVPVVPDVTGFKWEDLNGDGTPDDGERRLSGIYIYADLDGDNRIDIGEPQAITRQDGTYSLSLPGPGTYSIREVLPAGYAQSFPGPDVGNEHIIVFNGTSLPGNLNFGNRLAVDFGDAPDSYGTTLASNGARHGLLDGFGLGQTIRDEADARTPLNGTGEGSEEDGVTFLSSLLIDTTDNRLQVNLRNSAGVIGYVHGWIDFDRDGTFEASEQIIDDLAAGAGPRLITFDVPPDARQGTTYARFRYSTERNLGPSGAAVDGEVEDYAVIIGDASSDRLIAVDDTEFSAIPLGQTRSIDVLKNDLFGPAGTFSTITVGASALGATITVFDNGTPGDPTDDRLIYEAPTDVGGVPGATDQFTYTLTGLNNEFSTAVVTVQLGNSAFDDLVNLRLQPVDPVTLDPIDRVAPGATFKVQLYVQDLRGFSAVAPGVYAAFADVLFDKNLVSPIPNSTSIGFNIEFGADYLNNTTGDIDVAGLINELGAVQSNTLDPLGSEEILLATFDMVAGENIEGLAEIKLDPADLQPFSDTLLFEPPTVVPIEQIRFTPTSVLITTSSGSSGGSGGEGENNLHNSLNGLDVNNDGYVSPIDALSVINFLNRGRFGGGEGEGGSNNNLFVDVNNDRLVSPVDALMVINFLNRRSGGGEGEGANLLAGASSSGNGGGLIGEGEADVTSTTDAVFTEVGHARSQQKQDKGNRQSVDPLVISQAPGRWKSLSDVLALDVFRAWRHRRRG